MDQFAAVQMETSVIGYGGPGPFSFIVPAIAGIVLVAAWVILAGSRFVQGGVVERPERVPQLYGYTVCLVSLIWALGSGVALIQSGLTLTNPGYSSENYFGMEPSITSFEAFRLTYDRARRFTSPDPNAAKLDSVPEAELRQRYETLRTDLIQTNQVRARQELVTRGISLILAVAVFGFHWRWLRQHSV
jgi:hypothetical protein